jgi:hypothetical protein
MKRIALLKDNSFPWGVLESYLGSINAEVVVLDPGVSADEITESGASLLIMGMDQLPSLRSALKFMKSIVIHDGRRSLPGQTRKSQRNTIFLQWPVSTNRLLAETASMLGISPRKDFVAVVRIFSPDTEVASVGKSIDFSLSGMSFAAAKYYSIGHRVSINFSPPEGHEKIVLEGRVVRAWTNEVDGSGEYGLEFNTLSRSTGKALKDFVLD